MVVDSSVLIEILLKHRLHEKCLRTISSQKVFIPVLAYFECYKKLRSKASESDALEAMGSLEKFEIISITREIALFAGDLSIEYGLPMADSLVLACAREYNVTLLTLDNDFAKIPGVKVIR